MIPPQPDPEISGSPSLSVSFPGPHGRGYPEDFVPDSEDAKAPGAREMRPRSTDWVFLLAGVVGGRQAGRQKPWLFLRR